MAEAASCRRILMCVLFWILQVEGAIRTPDLAWGNNCPVACSCHVGHFADLPINQLLQKEEVKVTKSRTSPSNEAYYESTVYRQKFTLPNSSALLKIAICVFQSGSDAQELLQKLPNDTQALTLLQSRGSEEITLEAEHMKQFQQLIYLDIEGYCPEALKEEPHEHTTDHNFMLSNDVLKPIASLQYLSLQHIKLLGSSIKSNEIDHEGRSSAQIDLHQNEIPMNFQMEMGNKFIKRIMGPFSNLIFLKPTDTEKEPVPYIVYKEQQERARLSIFAQLSNLILLRVVDCGLHEVYWEMFEGLRKLEYLSLEKNQLMFLPDFAFYGAPNLKTLSLAHNKLLTIQSTGLAGLLELQKLDLSYNNFSHLSEFSLPPFPKLKEAYFWHNPLEAAFSSTFEIMNATTVLYLGGHNSSLTLHPNSFQGLNHLKKLVINNIGIEVLERELLSGMPQLKFLKMSGIITSISFDAFLDVPLLETLELQNCKIKSVSMDAFYGLYRLVVLNLSNNLLESLPPGIFDQQFSLKELYLQNNSLTDLPDGFFISLSAKMVRLEGNLWNCSCNMKGWLAAATNRIKEVRTERIVCENDKGVGCPDTQSIVYIYEKKVAPRCTTPLEYKGWSVYHVLRKELRCSKQAHKKFNRREYLRRKHSDYERSNLQVKQNNSNNANQRGITNIASATTFYAHGQTSDRNVIVLNKPLLSIFHNVKSKNITHDRGTLSSLSSTAELHNATAIVKLLNESNINSTNSANSQNVAIENNVPVIPIIQKQNNLHPETLNDLHLSTSKIKRVDQHPDSHLASHSQRKIEVRTLHKTKQPKFLPQREDPRLLKQIWRNEQERKRQEKIKNSIPM